MINDIEFKDHNGYLQATIDNQTIPLKLREIVKDKVTIKNIANTGIPLYTPIPIDVIFTTNKNNIIEQGSVELKIFDKEKIIHEENGYIVQGEYKTNINKNLALGTYIIDINYLGGKYFEPAKLQYYLTVGKRSLLFKMDKDQYHGKPYEDIEVHLEIYDSLNKIPITNTRIDYIYDDIHYITKSNDIGAIDFQVTISNECQGQKIIIYIENEIYEYTFTEINIITDRLDTEIQNTQSFDDDNIIIKGNVFAYNGDTMYNASYGDIKLYIEDEEVDAKTVENGIFELTYDYKEIISEYSSSTNTFINEKSDISTKIKLDSEIKDVPGEGKFTVTVTDYNNRKITDGMVYFQLNDGVNYYTSELDENGQAICYFYIPKKDNYKIKYRYFGIFEYKDSDVKEAIIEVK